MKRALFSLRHTTTPAPCRITTRRCRPASALLSPPYSRLFRAILLCIPLLVWIERLPQAPPLPVAGVARAARVYTVAAMARKLARHPSAWRGQTVYIQGRLVLFRWYQRRYTLSELLAHARLVDAAGTPDFPVAPPSAHALDAAMRRLPLIGRLWPGSHLPVVGRVAVYRVRFRVAPPGACPVCYEAVLVDVG